MNKKLKISMIILGIVALVSVGLLTLKEYMITSSPINNLEYSIFKTAKEENYDISLDIDFSVNKNDLSDLKSDDNTAYHVIKMLDKVNMVYNLKLITDKPNEWIEAKSTYSLSYDKDPILDFQMILNSEVLGFGINNFYDKYFTLKYEDFLKKILEKENDDFDLDKYFDILKDKKSDEYKAFLRNSYKYKTIVDKYLENNLTEEGKSYTTINGKDIEVREYKININREDYLYTFTELLNELKEDENLKAYSKNKLIEILNLILESEDYKLLDLSRNDLEEVIKKVEDDFSNIYENSFDRYLLGIDKVKLSNNKKDSHYIVSIDKKHKIRKVKAILENDYIDIEVNYSLNNFGKDVLIKNDEDKYIDVSKYYDIESDFKINDDEVSILLKTISLGVIKEVIESDGYKTLSKDLSYFKDYMNEVLDQLNNMKETIKKMDFKDLLDGYIGNL